MYRFFIYPLLVLGCLFIQAQDQSLIPKTDTISVFDVLAYKEKKIDTLSDGTIIKSWWNLDYYQENITKINSPYKLVKLYDPKSGEYRGGGLYFYSILLNNWKIYDKNKNVIKYRSEYRDFPFSYEQLLAKMRREYNLDLEKEYAHREYINVRRSTGDKFDDEEDYCIYVIIYALTEEELKNYHPTGYDYISTEPREHYYSKIRRRLYINGQTGEVEVDIITNYDEYANHYFQRWIEGEKFLPAKKRKL